VEAQKSNINYKHIDRIYSGYFFYSSPFWLEIDDNFCMIYASLPYQMGRQKNDDDDDDDDMEFDIPAPFLSFPKLSTV
jgi:hypothetical protein